MKGFLVSIGILDVTACPNGDTPDDLLRRADMAMYSAKRSGKGRSVAFDVHAMLTAAYSDIGDAVVSPVPLPNT